MDVQIYVAASTNFKKEKVAYTSFLSCKEKIKKISGVIERETNKIGLYVGFLEAVKLIKKPCTVTLYTLQHIHLNNKKHREFAQEILSIMTNRKIKFTGLVIPDVSNSHYSFLEKAKRISESFFKDDAKVEFSQSKLSTINRDEFTYLNSLSLPTKEFVFNILEHTGLNLYHSMQAIIEAHKNKLNQSINVADYYYDKYKNKRPYLIGNKEKIVELATLCFERRKRKKANR